MKPCREIVALTYREVVWFRRFIGEFALTWIFPLLFALAVIGLPAAVSGFDVVLAKFGSLMGFHVTLREAMLAVIASSSVLNVVAVVVGDVMHTLYFEFRTEETVNTVIMATTIRRYATATAIVRSLTMTSMSTPYLLVAFTFLRGLEGLTLYALIMVPLLLSAVCLGLLSVSIALVSYYYAGVRRPWAITGLLTPAILAGSGVFVPLELVPRYLRFLAQATPVPYTAEAVRSVVFATAGLLEHLKPYMPVVVAFYTAYYVLTFSVTRVSERKVRSGW